MNDKIENKLEDLCEWIIEQFNFGVIRDEYIKIYPHTILKSLVCVYDQVANNSSNNTARFDIQTVSRKGIFSDILYWLQSNYQLNISEIINYVSLLYTSPNSFEQPSSDPRSIRVALIACYEIICIIMILYLEPNKEIDRDRLIYLPIEQECSIGYFIGRYINKIILSPETTEEFNNGDKAKKYYYYKLDQLAQHHEDNKETFRFNSDIYSHSNKNSDNKKNTLSRHHLIGKSEDFSLYTLNDIVCIMAELDSKDIRIQKLVDSPSSETLPYLGYSALNNKCALVSSTIC